MVVDEHATGCEPAPGVGAWRYDFETMPSSRRVDPPTLVTVTTTAPWPVGDWPGLLSYWRRDADGWRGFVAFTGVGENRLGWFPADHLRPGVPLGGRDEVREVDVPLKFSDRPAVVDRTQGRWDVGRAEHRSHGRAGCRPRSTVPPEPSVSAGGRRTSGGPGSTHSCRGRCDSAQAGSLRWKV